MQRAKELDVPIIGVCRGAQMLCALAGGFLIQDVTAHGRSHMATTSKGDMFQVSSLHHQMMYPFEVEHEMLAWASRPQSAHYLDVDTPIEVKIEPEAVWFPKVKGFAIQWHPEFMDSGCTATKYCHEVLKGYL
jgi:gamma-glutamyl-gamma-aminobutyrate hydrolase PuuD